MKKRYTEEQIIGFLREARGGPSELDRISVFLSDISTGF